MKDRPPKFLLLVHGLNSAPVAEPGSRLLALSLCAGSMALAGVTFLAIGMVGHISG